MFYGEACSEVEHSHGESRTLAWDIGAGTSVEEKEWTPGVPERSDNVCGTLGPGSGSVTMVWSALETWGCAEAKSAFGEGSCPLAPSFALLVG